MELKVPKHKPRIVQKEQDPDKRIVSVVPIRAVGDRTLTAPQYRVLLAFASYANKGGITWVGMDRIAADIGISQPRVSKVTRQLIDKGYIRILRMGYPGERAQTRQIVYSDRTLEEIVAITGEKPPFMINQERREMEKILKKQELAKTQAKEGKRPRGRPRKTVAVESYLGTDQKREASLDCNSQTGITELLSRLDSTLAIALKQQLPADATLAQYQSALDRMLR